MTNYIDDRLPTKGWQANPIVRFFSLLFGGLWRFIGHPFWIVGREIVRYVITVFVFGIVRTTTYTRTNWSWIIDGYEPSDDVLGRIIDRTVGGYMRDPWIRIPFAIGSLIIGTPLMFVMVLVVGFGIPVALALTVDQLTYPEHRLAPEFSLEGPNAGREMTQIDKTILVTDALVYQLEHELDSATDMTVEDWKTLDFNSFWGWTPNDVAGYGPLAVGGPFDNRANRQLGVIYAVRIMTDAWSQETSKLGSADRESVDLVAARTQGFSLSSSEWYFPSSESYYRSGIESIHTYQQKLITGSDDARTNVTTRNLVGVLKALDSMLQEPYGRLIDRNATVGWTELDDTVFYAQGAAIVTRDILAALSVAYAEEFERGALELQLAEAISSLEAAAQFNPLFVLRGDGDSMLGDHRAKMGRYVSEAFRRIEDIYEALES
jgi:hypothetical protein